MFQLMVSYDCGLNYAQDSEAETIDELKPRMMALDDQGLRWTVERDGQLADDLPMCRIFAGILSSLITFQAKEQINVINQRTITGG